MATIVAPIKSTENKKYDVSKNDITEMLEFSEFIKAYALVGPRIHNGCLKGAQASKYQLSLRRNSNHIKSQKKSAEKELALNNTPENQQRLLQLQQINILLTKKIDNNMKKAAIRYRLIIQANWIFVTVFELLKSSNYGFNVQKGHSIGKNNEVLLIIQLDDYRLCIPLRFTKLLVDKDGFGDVIEHQPVIAGEYYEGVKDIFCLKPELLLLIAEAKKLHNNYPDPVK